MNNSYSIYEANYRALCTKLDRLNTKLARINVAPVTWRQVGTHEEPHPTIGNALVRYIDIEVAGTVPAENGWSFVATLVHTEEGNIMRTVPGYIVPVEFRDRPTWCDHCKCNRVRRDTYIVRHEKDGRVMQVGSSCLAEFVGTTNPHGLTKAADLLLNAFDVCDAAQKREWLGGNNAISTYRFDLDTYLSYVAAVVLKDGRFITRKMEHESEGKPNYRSATSTRALNAMNHPELHPALITPEAEKLAAEAREFVLRRYSPVLEDVDNMSPDEIKNMVIASFKAANKSLSDFEHNLLSCARAEAIEPRLCGVAAYIIESYRRSLPRPEAAQLNVEGLLRIFAMFDKAKDKLKKPAVRLAHENGQRLHLSLAGMASKNAGSVYVKADSGFNAQYYGKITPEGRFFRSGSCPATVEPLLQAFANDPEGIATKYGRLTGCCSFCGRKLTDARSTEVGYGPVCADKFGLDWGKKLIEAVAA